MQQFLQYALIMVIGVSLQQPADAFMNGGRALSPRPDQICSKSSSALGSGDFFEGFRRLFQGGDDGGNEDSDVDENLPAGTTILASIPGASSLKNVVMNCIAHVPVRGVL
jgi:hypothetical protein